MRTVILRFERLHIYHDDFLTSIKPFGSAVLSIDIPQIATRIFDPLVDGGFAPACAADADAHLLGERPLLHLSLEGRAVEAGTGEDGLDADDAVRIVGHDRSPDA